MFPQLYIIIYGIKCSLRIFFLSGIEKVVVVPKKSLFIKNLLLKNKFFNTFVRHIYTFNTEKCVELNFQPLSKSMAGQWSYLKKVIKENPKNTTFIDPVLYITQIASFRS